jgi:hypothetical protein
MTLKTISFTKSTILYSCSSLGLLILFDPNSCLAPFILVSAFHFGDQQGLYFDFNFKIPINFLSFYLESLYSSCYFSFIEVEEIVTEIIRFKLPYYYINEIFIISAFLFISMSSYFYWNLNRLEKNTCRIVFLLVFAIIFKTSSLIWGCDLLYYMA